jgi:hypothetical protein
MANDREIELIISAQNLTTESFKKVEAAIARLEAQAKETSAQGSRSFASMSASVNPLLGQLSLADRAANVVKSTFGQMFAAFGAFNLISRGVGLLVSWGQEALAGASAIVDLSNKTGLTTDTIQRFQFVAGQTGTSVESFTRAAFQFGRAAERWRDQRPRRCRGAGPVLPRADEAHA